MLRFLKKYLTSLKEENRRLDAISERKKLAEIQRRAAAGGSGEKSTLGLILNRIKSGVCEYKRKRFKIYQSELQSGEMSKDGRRQAEWDAVRAKYPGLNTVEIVRRQRDERQPDSSVHIWTGIIMFVLGIILTPVLIGIPMMIYGVWFMFKGAFKSL